MHKFSANRKIGEEDMQEQPRHPQGEDLASVKTVLIVGVELRLLEPSAREQSDPSNLSAFFGRRRQHAPQDFTQRLQDILEGPFDTVGSLQRAYTFQQLAQETLFMVNG